MLKDNYYCTCGHSKKYHADNVPGGFIPNACYIKGVRFTTHNDCPCDMFVPDNLLTLEKLSAKMV